MNFLIENTDLAIAIGTMTSSILALIALITSMIAVFFQRKHNRLSFRPIGYVTIGNYEDDIYVKISNFGTGPLIVNKLEVIYENEKYDTLISLSNKKTKISVWRDYVENIEGRAIPPNGEIVLLRFQEKNDYINKIDHKKKLRQLLSKTIVIVEYNDIYNKKMKKCERNLKIFKKC